MSEKFVERQGARDALARTPRNERARGLSDGCGCGCLRKDHENLAGDCRNCKDEFIVRSASPTDKRYGWQRDDIFNTHREAYDFARDLKAQGQSFIVRQTKDHCTHFSKTPMGARGILGEGY